MKVTSLIEKLTPYRYLEPATEVLPNGKMLEILKPLPSNDPKIRKFELLETISLNEP